jgi:DNA mismatch repair ATPase MutL
MYACTGSVEDLFYNMDARRRAFKTTSEQYQRILDVVTRYAIHYGGREISFTCKVRYCKFNLTTQAATDRVILAEVWSS